MVVKKSKNAKISWRKRSKVADVEEFLEQQRQDERLGVDLLPTIPNEQLFVLDTHPKKDLISFRKARRIRAKRPLKGFSALQPHTSVPDPVKKRNRVATREERKSDFAKKKDEEKSIERTINAISQRRAKEIQAELKSKRGDFVEDVWGDKTAHTISEDPWAENVTKVHTLRNTGVPVKSVRKDLVKKKSVLPAVEPPHPGMSYNPSFKDHQDLLRKIAEDETKVIKKEEHIKRVTGNMFRKIGMNAKQSEWLVEMSEGMIKDEVEAKEEKPDVDNISINPPVQNKKKSLKQRRKQREQLELEKQKLTKKTEKKKITDIHRIKLVQTNIQKAEKKQEKLRKLREVREKRKELKPKMLSRRKFEDPGPDFQLGSDISGNLRGLKKEGNLLADRFASLQKRNVLAPTKRAHQKKSKVKKYTKPGHKDDLWEGTVARIKTPNKINKI